MNKNTKICFTLMFALQFLIIALLIIYMMTRPMLDARTVIQTTNTKALKRLRAFTPSEECLMKAAWEKAEYFGEPNIFAGAQNCDEVKTSNK